MTKLTLKQQMDQCDYENEDPIGAFKALVYAIPIAAVFWSVIIYLLS